MSDTKKELEEQTPGIISGITFDLGKILVSWGYTLMGSFAFDFSGNNISYKNVKRVSRPVKGFWTKGDNNEPLFIRTDGRNYRLGGQYCNFMYEGIDEILHPYTMKVIEYIEKNKEEFVDSEGEVEIPVSDVVKFDVAGDYKPYNLDANLTRRIMSDAIERREATTDDNTIKNALVKLSYVIVGAIATYIGTTSGSGGGSGGGIGVPNPADTIGMIHIDPTLIGSALGFM